MSSFDEFLLARLAEIEAAGLRRRLRTVDSPQGAVIEVEGRQLVNFSSNDYLGLANHPALRTAAAAALEEAGAGSGASRLICGNHRFHEELESTLAAFKRTETALTFSTGYAAAVGAISALAGKDDILILDKLCHASLVDGARLSGATLRVFPHNHLEKLESHLRWAREKFPTGRIIVLAESVYSMDGDRAPLREIVELKDRFGAWLFLDEAHGVGVVGDEGRGLADHLGVSDRVEIQMGTLGKALGASGAYIAGSAALRDYLINKARSFIFSTAVMPATAAAATAAVRLLESEEGRSCLRRLRENLLVYGRGTGLSETPSAIFPVLVGDESLAVQSAQRLSERGFLVAAIRYPTVALGAARLRVVVTAAHQAQQIRRLVVELHPD